MTTTATFQLIKDAYKGHPKEIWALSILTLINRSGTMVLPFLTVYLTTQLNFTFKEAGFLASAFGFGSFFGSYLGGQLSDKIGPNPVITASMFIGGLFFILLQWAFSFWAIFSLIFLTALFGQAYRPAMTASAANYVPQEQMGRTMSFLRLAINLGMSIAPLIGGFVAVALGYKWLFWLDGITCIAGGIYFLIVSKNWKKHEDAIQQKATKEAAQDAPKPFQNKKFMLYLLGTFLVGFSFVQWFHTVPVFMKVDWGYDERYIGLMIALSCTLVVLFEMPFIHNIEKNKQNTKYTLIGLILIGVSFLPFLLPKALIWCFVGITIVTFGEILYLPFNHSTSVELSPVSRRGEYQSWFWMTWSLSSILAPIVGLGFADIFNFSSFWLVIIGITVVSYFLTKRVLKKV